MKVAQKDYLVIVKALVLRHQDTHSEWEKVDIVTTLMKLLPKVTKHSLYVDRAEQLVAEVADNAEEVAELLTR